MPGPEPSESRRRRVVPEKLKQQVVLPAGGREGPPPSIPLRGKLEKQSLEQWEAWWRSPMATMWDDQFDVFALARCLQLYDRMRRDGVTNGELTEIRQIEARFGLDPRSRKELCWVIADPPVEEPSRPGSSRPQASSDELAERRRRVEIAAGA